MNRAQLYRILTIIGFVALLAAAQNTAEVRRLTLTESVHLALTHNRELKIARMKVAESEQKRAQVKASYFPNSRTNRHSSTRPHSRT
jgi:outer membrane protein TolC